MATIISILTILACIVLTGVILIQNSKGGGLTAGLTSSNQFLGVRKTNDVLEKATWTVAIALLCLCLLATVFDGSGTVADNAPKSTLENLVPSSQLNPNIGQSQNSNLAPSTQPGVPPAGQPQPVAPQPQPAQ